MRQPVGWAKPTAIVAKSYTIKIDSSVTKEGKYALSITKTSYIYPLCSVLRTISHTYQGREVQLKGYLKTENITQGFAGLILGVVGTEGALPLAWETMEDRKIAGTTDWKEYTITLPYNDQKARSIYIGATLSGNGKLWADDFRLFIDGKPIEQAKLIRLPPAKSQEDSTSARRLALGTPFRMKLKELTTKQRADSIWAVPKVKKTEPLVFGFYEKLIDQGGIPIRAANVVEDRALVIAYQKMNKMLIHMPEARQNLIEWGAEMHIIGKDQQASDLPESRDQKGKIYIDNVGNSTDIDSRTRGTGGLYASCGEENLLNLPGDRYAGMDICIHEFAHDIMLKGLNSSLRNAIEKQYQKSTSKGLWKNAYAAVNTEEYWAELSMWYFGSHGEFLKNTNTPTRGLDGLRSYDPEGFALVNAIYSGKVKSSVEEVRAERNIQKILLRK